VMPGAVFAQLSAPGQIRLLGSDYVLAVRRDAGTPSAAPLRLVVSGTLGQGVNLREAPSVTAGYIRTIPANKVVVATGQTEVAQGYAWYQVKDDRGTIGWVQGSYLALAPSN
jgi:SH3-like domain-containing protein